MHGCALPDVRAFRTFAVPGRFGCEIFGSFDFEGGDALTQFETGAGILRKGDAGSHPGVHDLPGQALYGIGQEGIEMRDNRGRHAGGHGVFAGIGRAVRFGDQRPYLVIGGERPLAFVGIFGIPGGYGGVVRGHAEQHLRERPVVGGVVHPQAPLHQLPAVSGGAGVPLIVLLPGCGFNWVLDFMQCFHFCFGGGRRGQAVAWSVWDKPGFPRSGAGFHLCQELGGRKQYGDQDQVLFLHRRNNFGQE